MKKNITAILCDLDGVLTQTASQHAKAWKRLFDELLKKERNIRNAYHEFDVATDYPQYIDGKPRLEGIRTYLLAHDIEIPEGSRNDPPNAKTVNGLAKKKNNIFHKLLTEEGIETYLSSIKAVKSWKEKGMKTAVVSSSKNCRFILDVAGITHLFDVIVDGLESEKKGLQGKPQPDTFLYAAQMLNVKPAEAAVAEDAIAGIEAAVKGGFGLVIGIFKENNAVLLKQSKADVIVRNLSELAFTGKSLRYPHAFEKLEHACLCEHHIGKALKTQRPVFFFDYDGTLTPIVAHPEAAILSSTTKEKLAQLADLAVVSIISGRDKDDVKELVGIKNIFYAGSHGFDIEGPGKVSHCFSHGDDIIRSVKQIIPKLQEKLKGFEGVQIESKKYAVAVHYRNALKKRWSDIIDLTQQIANEFSTLKTGEGKMVMEVRPNIDWDKGKAMQWMAGKLSLNAPGFHHIYIGDDITDEDAFKALPENGTGILIGNHESATYADYHIDNVAEIDGLLDSFISIIQRQNCNG